jgi:large subunit ribosomal protein L19
MQTQNIKPGDLVKVNHQITESGKVRTQVFKGTIISVRGRKENKSFTVRKIADGGVAVERIWPILSPAISKIEVLKSVKVRRAKLYYLRNLTGKKARAFQ